MSLHSICFPISQTQRLEYYRIGLLEEVYPHGYILSELLKVIDSLPLSYLDDINKRDTSGNEKDSILENAIEASKKNAEAFLDKFSKPDLYRIESYDHITYEYKAHLIPEYDRVNYIVHEAAILRGLVESILESRIKISAQKRSINGAILEIVEFDKLVELFKTRLVEITLVPELMHSEKRLPVINKKETFEISKSHNDDVVPIDEIEWQTMKSTAVLDVDFRYVVKNFITLPWLELLHTIKNSYIVYKCPICNNYYFHYVKKRKNCEKCGYPSTKQTEEKRIRDRYKKKIEEGMPRDQANKELQQKYGLKPIYKRAKKGENE